MSEISSQMFIEEKRVPVDEFVGTNTKTYNYIKICAVSKHLRISKVAWVSPKEKFKLEDEKIEQKQWNEN